MIKKLNQTELDLIIELHNEWRKDNAKKDVRRCLSSVDISGLKVFRCSLHNIKLIDSKARNVNFLKSGLNKVVAKNTDFESCCLSYASIVNSSMQECNFKNSNLNESFCNFTDFSYSNFQGASLCNVKFLCSNLTGISVSENTDFNGAVLYNVIIDESTKQTIEALNIRAEFIHESFYKIVRSLRFPPGYQQAGALLLSHLSCTINEEYFNRDVKIKIEQEGMQFKLTVKSKNKGLIEEIRILLRKYSLLLDNEITPGEFYKKRVRDRDLKIKQLQNELSLIKSEIATLGKNVLSNFTAI